MKKPFKIGCLIFLVIGLVLMIGQFIWNWKEGPTQTFALLNTAEITRSVTFEKKGKKEDSTGVYTIDNTLKKGNFEYVQVTPGKYTVSIWNADKSLYKSFDYPVILENPNKTNYQPFRLDIALDKVFTVVNLNFLYEGNAFSEFMSNAVGSKQTKLKFEKFYKGDEPFFIPDEYTGRTFVDLDDKIPSKVKYGEMVYGLFAFPRTLPKEQVEAEILTQIASKMK